MFELIVTYVLLTLSWFLSFSFKNSNNSWKEISVDLDETLRRRANWNDEERVRLLDLVAVYTGNTRSFKANTIVAY